MQYSHWCLWPEQHRRSVFDTLHSLSHPGVAASVKLITARFFWPNVRRAITNWARACLQCQRAKVQHHVRAPLGVFSPPEKRFRHVHIDIVGPWPVSSGCPHVSIVSHIGLKPHPLLTSLLKLLQKLVFLLRSSALDVQRE